MVEFLDKALYHTAEHVAFGLVQKEIEENEWWVCLLALLAVAFILLIVKYIKETWNSPY